MKTKSGDVDFALDLVNAAVIPGTTGSSRSNIVDRQPAPHMHVSYSFGLRTSDGYYVFSSDDEVS